MQLIKNKKTWKAYKIYRLAGILIAAFVVSFCLELICNYQSLMHGYGEIDLTSAVKFDGADVVCEYSFPESVYIDKLRIKGNFDQNLLYTVEVHRKNAFGKEERENVLDQAYSVFEEAYSPIKSDCDKIVLKMENAKDAVKIQQIAVNNQFSVNKYRLLLFFVTVLAAGLLFFEKEAVTKYLEYYFLVFALGFGMIMIVMVGPKNVTWDEQIHYKNMYTLLEGDTVEWNKAAWLNHKQLSPDINTREEMHLLKEYLNQSAKVEYHSNPNDAKFSNMILRAYLPMSVCYKIGEVLDLPYSLTFMLGKLGNLLAFTGIIWLALHFARERKILIFSLAVMPTVLFQGSMYSYDGIVNSLVLLGFVLMMNEFYDSGKLNPWRIGSVIILLIVGSYSKAIYIPLILLLLALPGKKFENKKQSMMFKGMVAIVFLLVMATFVMPVLANTIEGNLLYSDARGGDTSTFRQLQSIFTHPIASIKLFLSSITSLDNFRNLGYAAADNHLITNLMFLNFASLGTLGDKWSLLLIPMLFAILFIPNEQSRGLSKGARVWCGLILLAVVALIWMALYLSFTPVGSDYIDGVQARYYFPLILPLSYLTWRTGAVCRKSLLQYNRMIIVINGILMFTCIYQLIFQTRCL